MANFALRGERGTDGRSTRRGLGAALLALAAGSLATRVASALPRRLHHLLREANELLRPLRLEVSATDGRRGVITVSAAERDDTELAFVVTEHPGAVEPCVKTTFLNHVAEFTHFQAGAADVRALVDGPLVSFERFDLAESRTAATVRTTIEDTVTSFEHFDPAKSAIDPCWKAVVTEGASRSGADNTTVTVVDTAIDFSVVVGGRTWTLRNGALEETRI